MCDGLFGWRFDFHLPVQCEVTVKHTLLSETSLNGKIQENKHCDGVYYDTENLGHNKEKKKKKKGGEEV